MAANDGRIPHEGEWDLNFQTTEGNSEDMTFQVAEVNKALGAVSYIVGKGYRVIFDKNMVTGQDMSFMTNTNAGLTSRFLRERNVWVLDAFVNLQTKGNSNDDQGFARRGQA